MRFNDTLIEVLKQDLEMGIVPALMGEPGIGKSSAVGDLAYAMGTKLFVLPCNTLADKSDLTGARLVPTDNGGFKQVFYPHHVIQEAVDYAEANPRETPLLMLDEINRTNSDVTSGALTITTMRKLGHIELPSNLRIIVAGNDKGNVIALDDASLSRFAIYHVEPDASTLIQILGDTLNPWVKTVLETHPEAIFEKAMPQAVAVDGDDDDDPKASIADIFDGGEEMNQLTTPRTIDNVSRWLNRADRSQLGTYLATPSEQVSGSLLDEIVQAKIGNTTFALQLVKVISDDLVSHNGNATQTRINVPRPACFDTLKAALTITDLETAIQGLTDNERSTALLFAIYETADNERLVQSLADSIIGDFSGEHTVTLMEIARAGQAHRGNLEAFLASRSALADRLRPVVSAYL